MRNRTCQFSEHFIKLPPDSDVIIKSLSGANDVKYRQIAFRKEIPYRRPRHSYYTMKAKQEPVSRFDISWYTWAENLVYCLFLRFC